MSEAIVIQIELQANVDKTFKDLENKSEKTGEKVSTNIATQLEEKLGKSIDKSSSKIESLVSKIAKIGVAFATVAPVVVFLEKRFSLFTKLFDKLGLNLENIKNKFEEMKDTLAGFALGEKSLTQLKIAAGFFLQELGLVDSKIISILGAVSKLSIGFNSAGAALSTLAAVGVTLVPIVRNFKDITKFSLGLGGILTSKSSGLFGFTSNLAGVSVGLAALGSALEQVDNTAAKTVAGLSKLGAILLGSISAAIGFAIIKLSELGKKLGDFLVGYFKTAAETANGVEATTDVFVAAVAAINRSIEGNIGTSEDWITTINKVADTFNLSRKEVTKSAQEIALVGSKIGLTATQMEKLTKVSAEYAKINKKDVFQTTVNVVNALNGNAQAVQAYGIKLGKVAVQQSLYKKGITRTLASMSEGEKVQQRYNKLLSQYKDIAGVGAVAANTLADQQERLELNQKRLTSELGKGARIIEKNNIAAFAYNLVLDNINDNVLKVTGFLGAFGARVLQVGSVVLGLSFKLFTVVKVLKILSLFLSSKLGASFFTSTIPLINTSLDVLIAKATQTTIKVRDLKTALLAAASAMKVQFSKALFFITGQTTATANAMNILTGALTKLRTAAKLAYIALAPLLIPIAKIVSLVALVVGPIIAFYKAFEVLEEKTGLVSEVFNIFIEALKASGGIFASLGKFLGNMTESIKNLAKKGFGVLIDSIATYLRIVVLLAKKNPFGVFSKKTIASLTAVDAKLKTFLTNFQAVALDIDKISGNVSRSIAGGLTVNLEELARNLAQVSSTLENAGLTQTQIIEKTAAKQREIIRLALANRLLDAQSASALLVKVAADRQMKLQGLSKKTETMYQKLSKSVTSSLQNGVASGVSSAFAIMGKSLAGAGDQGRAFFATMLNIFGDLAISIGTTIIATAKAITALKASITGSSITPIILGGGLIALGAILKTVGSKQGAPSGGGGGISAGAGGGGIASGSPSGSTDNVVASNDTEERREESTNVQLIVQGDILDSQESGTRLAKILSDAFEQDGIVLNNGATA